MKYCNGILLAAVVETAPGGRSKRPLEVIKGGWVAVSRMRSPPTLLLHPSGTLAIMSGSAAAPSIAPGSEPEPEPKADFSARSLRPVAGAVALPASSALSRPGSADGSASCTPHADFPAVVPLLQWCTLLTSSQSSSESVMNSSSSSYMAMSSKATLYRRIPPTPPKPLQNCMPS